jgi:hypothetical protein
MLEDFLEPGDAYLTERSTDSGKYLIMDLNDLFQEMRQKHKRIREQPAWKDNPVGLDGFMQDIFDNVCYLKHLHNTVGDIGIQIADVLDNACQYFDIDEDLSQHARRIWAEFAHAMIERFKEHRLYGRDHIHLYEYWSLRDKVLKLKLWES